MHLQSFLGEFLLAFLYVFVLCQEFELLRIEVILGVEFLFFEDLHEGLGRFDLGQVLVVLLGVH